MKIKKKTTWHIWLWKNFYYRINGKTIHSLEIKSKYLIFHEVTSGPFVRKNTIYKNVNLNFEKKILIVGGDSRLGIVLKSKLKKKRLTM